MDRRVIFMIYLSFVDFGIQDTAATEASITVNATDITSTSLQISWQAAPYTTADAIVVYGVRYKEKNTTEENSSAILVCKRRTKILLTDLKVYTNYTVEVVAFNNTSSVADVVVTIRTDEGVPTSAPLNVKAVNESSTSIVVSWEPVPERHRHGVIRNYAVDVAECDDGAGIPTKTFNTTDFQITIDGLKKFTCYQVKVKAGTIKGHSKFSPPYDCKTGQDAPEASPRIRDTFTINASSIVVSLDPVIDGKLNGFLREYKLYWKRTDSSSNYTVQTVAVSASTSRRKRRSVESGPVTNITITDLDTFSNYTVQASAVTIAEGNKSSPTFVLSGEGVPKAPPLNVTAFNRSSSSLKVTWHPPEQTALQGYLRGYQVTSVAAHEHASNASYLLVCGEMTTITLSGLLKYTLYNVSVAAFTKVGVGLASNVTESWTDEDVPSGSPINVSALPESSHSIRVIWAPVPRQQQNGNIIKYYVEVHSKRGRVTNATVSGKKFTQVVQGLAAFSNFSARVQAFTRLGGGPFSYYANVTTHDAVPDVVPQNVTVLSKTATSIYVKWNPVILTFRHANLTYLVLYYLLGSQANRNNQTCIGPSINLTGLAVYTPYGIQVAAKTSQQGNYSQVLATRTGEGGAPPINILPKILGSTSARVTWDPVPEAKRNGIIAGYRVIYRRIDNNSHAPLRLETNNGTGVVLLTSLAKATEYEITVLAFTSKGDGPAKTLPFTTGEEAPSKAPSNLAVENFISLDRVRISWDPVPKEFLQGKLVRYDVTYQVMEIGLVSQQEEPVLGVPVDGNETSLELNNLEPYAVYKIAVAARTAGGLGPASDPVYGETCHCKKRLTTSWRRYAPYVLVTEDGEPGIIIPTVLQSMVEACCGDCLQHNGTSLDFKMNGRNNSSMVNSSRELLERLDENTDFAFPVHGEKEQQSYKGGFGYVPIVESAGVAFIVHPRTSATRQSMLSSLFLCLPVLLLPIIMAQIAGVIIWILERKLNSGNFPPPFFRGTWEGIWWSFVSMTTLGYGDRATVSSKGRLFAVLWILYGIVIIAITMAMLTTALTKITLESEPKLYGSKVAAEMNSPEYNLGRRRNALIDSEYHSLDEVVGALIDRKVEGILVDASSGGLRGDLFNKPSIRVSQILDYKTAYGIVLSPNSTRLRKCFSSYITSHRAEITEMVQNITKPIKTSEDQESGTESQLAGLYDSQSPTFQRALKYAAACTGVALFFALVYEFTRLLRQHHKVYPQEQYRIALQREMKALVQEFQERLTKKIHALKRKHRKELVKLIKAKAKAAAHFTGKQKADYLKSSKITEQLTLDDL